MATPKGELVATRFQTILALFGTAEGFNAWLPTLRTSFAM
jgi:hypothetical protein